ncbi:MAG: hypothetical protein IPK13_06280 [Deltaproteobacteria bacterium]|nr:hypothetical protein [Deltaproteobacteria bacterium]
MTIPRAGDGGVHRGNMLASALPLFFSAMLSGQFTSNTVTLPADALPPGWATVRAESDLKGKGFVHQVRVEIERGVPATVELFTSMNTTRKITTDGSFITVVATSDEGATWRKEILEDQSGEFTGTGFIGTPTDLSEFTDALHRSTSERWVVDRLVEDLKILAPEPLDAARCQVLAAMRLVIVVGSSVESLDPYVDCAARGAHVFAIAKGHDTSIGNSKTNASTNANTYASTNANTYASANANTNTDTREARPGLIHAVAGAGPTTWGLGAIALVEAVSPETVYPLVQARLEGSTVKSHQALLHDGLTPANQMVMGELKWNPLWPGRVRQVRHGYLFTFFVGAFVLLIGPFGYFVGIRPRRPWLAWGWFPAVSLAMCGAMYLVGRTNTPAAPHMDVGRVFVSTPTGEGMRFIFADLVGVEASNYALSIPWRDAETRWQAFEPPGRLGTPFEPSRVFAELRTTSGGDELEVMNLSLGRFTKARLAWSDFAVEAAPHVERTNPIIVVNPRDETVLRGVLVTHEGLTVFGTLAGRAKIELAAPTQPLPQDFSEEFLDSSDKDTRASQASRRWLRMLGSLRDAREKVAPGTYLLVTESWDDEVLEPTVSPPVEREGVTLRVVAGPFREVKAND